MKNQTKGTALFLAGKVRYEGEGIFSVESDSLRGWRYIVKPATENQFASCDCEDYRHRAKPSEQYRCKHIFAVRAAVIAARTTPTQQDQVSQ